MAESFNKTSNPQYSEFIHLSRYSRWIEEENRRETWEETVDRLMSFWKKRADKNGWDVDLEEIRSAILNLEVMGSMRSLMTAGEALERDNVAAFNCSYSAIDGKGKKLTLEHDELDTPVVVHLSNPVAFDELMYILLCGTGAGFSVERQNVSTLPKVGKNLNRRAYLPYNTNYPGVPKEDLSTYSRRYNTITVADTKYGWASALRILIFELYNGNFDVEWDTSLIRPAGARLKTFGGRASGPEPLHRLFEFCVDIFKKARGRKLTSLECHDICCMIADVVVVGGVRRSALISLSNVSDDRMRNCKSGQWWNNEPQRALANNSAAYTEKPDFDVFMDEVNALYKSKSGERGIFSRVAATKKAIESGRRDPNHEWGTNPCSEIILRPNSFCNLTEVVIRAEDTLDDIKRKVRIATILGTMQATLTDFKYLRDVWKKNTEEEALLGVSLTGIMDHPTLNGEGSSVEYDGDSRTITEHTTLQSGELREWLTEMKETAIEVNKDYAERLGINQSAAITCVEFCALAA